MRSGRRLALDIGTVRVGVAISDFHGILASGLETIKRDEDQSVVIRRVLEIITEYAPIDLYVGLPTGLSGRATASTRDAIQFAKALASVTDVAVRLVDERLSTVAASNSLRASGRDTKSGRKIIDQIAASIILEQALDIERSSGLVPGRRWDEVDG